MPLAATQLTREVALTVVYNHSVRTCLFARELATVNGLRSGVDYDAELVYLSCILRDLGATDHANGNQRFEVDGARQPYRHRLRRAARGEPNMIVLRR
jgi:hypothetical protein